MAQAADLAARAVAVTLAVGTARGVGRALRAEGGAAAVVGGIVAFGRANIGALVARASAAAVLAQRAVPVRGAACPGPWCAQQRTAAALVLLLMMRQRRALPERAGGGIAFVDMCTHLSTE